MNNYSNIFVENLSGEDKTLIPTALPGLFNTKGSVNNGLIAVKNNLFHSFHTPNSSRF
ncbi:MAG: hypothetical protein RIQ56_396 [Candidatus Parcubacteria bacterium]